MSEKVILHFLLDCSQRVAEMVKMTTSEAKKEIESWDDLEESR
jgi:hypothetical protein